MSARRWLGRILILLMFIIPIGAYAEIAGPEAFDGLSWELVHEEELHGGVIQSMCVTDNYIICIENMADNAETLDIVSAYYRYDKDADGNPVEQYSLANRVQEREWEHGNGMTYNRRTNEIYVSLYTNTIEENRGCLYVMDPDTLGYKRTIKVADDYNILGIDYIEETDQYVIQTNVDAGYSFKILDRNFQVVDDLGEFKDSTVGVNFQDCIVSGDYIITFPLTLDMGIGDYFSVYSIKGRCMVNETLLDFGLEEGISDEPESLCEIGTGEFLAVVNIYTGNANHVARFYKTRVPYYHYVTVESENGQVSGTKLQVLRGENCSVDFTPDEGYELSELTLDGVPQEMAEDAVSFSLNNVQADHTVKVIFTKIPFPVVKAVIIVVATVAAILVVFLIFHRIEQNLKRKRRREMLAKRRERNRRREQLLEKEMDQLEALEELIDRPAYPSRRPERKQPDRKKSDMKGTDKRQPDKKRPDRKRSEKGGRDK